MRGREGNTGWRAMRNNGRESWRERNNSKQWRGPSYLLDTTSFFTNFPDNFGREDMWKIFNRWESVKEVFIPPKNDKYGKRFGFVRFKHV